MVHFVSKSLNEKDLEMMDINMDNLATHIEAGRNVLVGGFGGLVYANAAAMRAGKDHSDSIYADKMTPDQVEGEIFNKGENEITVIIGFNNACKAIQDMIVELVKDHTIHGEKVPNSNSIIIVYKWDTMDRVDSRLLDLIPVREGFDN